MIYCTAYERRLKVKEIYDFADNYLRDWFPLLKGYVTFSKRVNRLAATSQALSSIVIDQCAVSHGNEVIRVVDSMPIISKHSISFLSSFSI